MRNFRQQSTLPTISISLSVTSSAACLGLSEITLTRAGCVARNSCRRRMITVSSPSHGENRGSSPLGSANDFKHIDSPIRICGFHSPIFLQIRCDCFSALSCNFIRPSRCQPFDARAADLSITPILAQPEQRNHNSVAVVISYSVLSRQVLNCPKDFAQTPCPVPVRNSPCCRVG
jgi:hypothetical protein